MLLNFKDDKSECPCPEEIRDQLLDFHEDLMTHCGKVFLILKLLLNFSAEVSIDVNRFTNVQDTY